MKQKFISYQLPKYILLYCYILILYSSSFLLLLFVTLFLTFCYATDHLKVIFYDYSSCCSNWNSKREDVQTIFVNHHHREHKVLHLFLLLFSFNCYKYKKNIELTMLSTSRVAIVSPTDPVCVAAQKMREFRVNSVVVATGNTLQGIFT